MTDPNLTWIVLVLDKSGSMMPEQQATIVAVNEFMEQQKLLPGKAAMTVVLFNGLHTVPPTIDLQSWEPLNATTYYPQGNTAMLHAVSHTVDVVGERLAALPEDQRPGKVILAIKTDGMENPPQPKSVWADLQKKLKHQMDKYGWLLIFMGANINAEAVAADMGIPAQFTMSYDASPKGTQDAYRAMTSRVTSHRTGGASGDANAQAVDPSLTAKIK